MRACVCVWVGVGVFGHERERERVQVCAFGTNRSTCVKELHMTPLLPPERLNITPIRVSPGST